MISKNRLVSIITSLADFSRLLLVDLLAATGAPPEWRPEAEIMWTDEEGGHGEEVKQG